MGDEQVEQRSLYEWIGGDEGLRELIGLFYPIVKQNPDIGPLFPEDIEPVMEKQRLFLTQFFGGPHLYSDKYGHPMMRARHMHFEITPARAEAWLNCMRQALKQSSITPELHPIIIGRLSGPAHHFVNA